MGLGRGRIDLGIGLLNHHDWNLLDLVGKNLVLFRIHKVLLEFVGFGWNF